MPFFSATGYRYVSASVLTFTTMRSPLVLIWLQVELNRMLQFVEDVEQALKQAVANLRQQISRNAFPIAVPPYHPLGHNNNSSSTGPVGGGGGLPHQASVNGEVAALNKEAVCLI